jgi:hypothetical protein
MSDGLRKAKIDELVKEHNLPAEIISRCVLDDGLVDTERLGIALQAVAHGASGRGVVDQAHLKNLKEAYGAAKHRGDTVSMVSLKRQIHEMGGTF